MRAVLGQELVVDDPGVTQAAEEEEQEEEEEEGVTYGQEEEAD